MGQVLSEAAASAAADDTTDDGGDGDERKEETPLAVLDVSRTLHRQFMHLVGVGSGHDGAAARDTRSSVADQPCCLVQPRAAEVTAPTELLGSRLLLPMGFKSTIVRFSHVFLLHQRRRRGAGAPPLRDVVMAHAQAADATPMFRERVARWPAPWPAPTFARVLARARAVAKEHPTTRDPLFIHWVSTGDVASRMALQEAIQEGGGRPLSADVWKASRAQRRTAALRKHLGVTVMRTPFRVDAPPAEAATVFNWILYELRERSTTPIVLTFSIKPVGSPGAHANALLLDPRHKAVFLVEPHMVPANAAAVERLRNEIRRRVGDEWALHQVLLPEAMFKVQGAEQWCASWSYFLACLIAHFPDDAPPATFPSLLSDALPVPVLGLWSFLLHPPVRAFFALAATRVPISVFYNSTKFHVSLGDMYQLDVATATVLSRRNVSSPQQLAHLRMFAAHASIAMAPVAMLPMCRQYVSILRSVLRNYFASVTKRNLSFNEFDAWSAMTNFAAACRRIPKLMSPLVLEPLAAAADKTFARWARVHGVHATEHAMQYVSVRLQGACSVRWDDVVAQDMDAGMRKLLTKKLAPLLATVQKYVFETNAERWATAEHPAAVRGFLHRGLILAAGIHVILQVARRLAPWAPQLQQVIMKTGPMACWREERSILWRYAVAAVGADAVDATETRAIRSPEWREHCLRPLHRTMNQLKVVIDSAQPSAAAGAAAAAGAGAAAAAPGATTRRRSRRGVAADPSPRAPKRRHTGDDDTI